MQDPWTWTALWGLPEGVGVLGGGEQRGKIGGNCNNINLIVLKMYLNVLKNKQYIIF